MNKIISYRIPPRDETTITLYDNGIIEIEQPPPDGEMTFPVRINTEDIATVHDILDKMRHHEVQEPETTAQDDNLEGAE